MPLDTSIPLGVQAPQFKDYSQDIAEQQMNALRAQVLQQNMQQNALTMQNTMEDRRRAEAARQQSAAEKAALKAQRAQILKEANNDPVAAASLALKYGYTGLAEDFAKARESVAKAGSEEAELEKKAFTNSFSKASVYAPLIANGAIPGRAVVGALFDDPAVGGVLSKVMTRDEALAFADKEPQKLAQILATPPDKIYDSFGVAASQAKPTVVSPGSMVTDLNPQSPTYRQVIAQGAPTEQQRKAETQTKQLKNSIGAAITSLEEMSKDGGLLDKATASGAGAAIDYGASVLGVATPGAIATGELQVLQDPILKMIPRFEGPQSDKDTLTYQQAAGQLANPNIPAAVRKAAAKTLIKLFKERQGQFAMPDLPEAETNTPSEFEGFVIKEK